MQVSCEHCQTIYDFDAALIPDEGYEAQCVTCEAIFFVNKEPPTSTALEIIPDALPSANEHAGSNALSSENPLTGLPTAPINSELPLAPIAPPAPHPLETARTAEMLEIPLLADLDLGDEPPLSKLEHEATAVEATDMLPKKVPDPDSATDPASALETTSTFISPSATSANTATPPTWPPAASGPTKPAYAPTLSDRVASDLAAFNETSKILPPKKSRRFLTRMLLVSGLLLLLGLIYNLLTYFFWPAWFEKTVGGYYRQLGIHVTPNPAALTLVKEGWTLMLQDTTADYQAAKQKFMAATISDPAYSKAWALAILADLFSSIDQDTSIQDLQAEQELIQSQIQQFTLAPGELAQEDLETLPNLQTLSAHNQQEINQKLKARLELATTALNTWTEVKIRLPHDKNLAKLNYIVQNLLLLTPLKSLAPETKDPAPLKESTFLPRKLQPAKDELDLLVLYIEAYKLKKKYELQEVSLDSVQNTYDQLLQREPYFERARYELAEFLEKASKNGELKSTLLAATQTRINHLLRTILQDTHNTHEKAQRLLKQLEAEEDNPVKETPQPITPPPNPPAKGSNADEVSLD